MKNFSTLLFVLLFALVGVLFYLQVSSKKADEHRSAKLDAQAHKINVAYVDIDTLENNYEYFKLLQKKYEVKRDSIDKALNSDYNAIENERLRFVQKGNTITEVEAQNFENAYKLKMQTLENKKLQLSKELNDEQAKGMDDVLSKIEAYMNEYNKNSHYSFVFGVAKGNMMFLHKDTACNITNEVLKGLNADYLKSAKK
ncbi:MAG: OmpH family outer membrane protein [Sphingobacteriales bacterium]|nr:MAG: OmpH family outer membrane protein [Sphingobacteriales bacterium]